MLKHIIDQPVWFNLHTAPCTYCMCSRCAVVYRARGYYWNLKDESCSVRSCARGGNREIFPVRKVRRFDHVTSVHLWLHRGCSKTIISQTRTYTSRAADLNGQTEVFAYTTRPAIMIICKYSLRRARYAPSLSPSPHLVLSPSKVFF